MSAETGTVTSDKGDTSPYIGEPQMPKVLFPGRGIRELLTTS